MHQDLHLGGGEEDGFTVENTTTDNILQTKYIKCQNQMIFRPLHKKLNKSFFIIKLRYFSTL